MHRTLTALLEARASSEFGITFITAADSEKRVPYHELFQLAKTRLGQFHAAGVAAGDYLIIQRADNEEFLVSFWACLLGGIVAVPVAPGNTAEHRHKLFRIANKLETAWLCADKDNAVRVQKFASELNLDDEWKQLSSRLVSDDAPGQTDVLIHKTTPDEPAFIQFSSGSTGTPKGVVLTHRNLTANIDAIIEGMAVQPKDRYLSWMPLTHDMGLIGFHLTPLAADGEQFLMPTELFVRRPQLWLAKAAEHRISALSSPNFGYQHFLKTFKAENTEHLDLSSVRLIFNGAEPISVDLCRSFMQSLQAAKLDQNAMFPVYGLAEASLAVSFPAHVKRFNTLSVARDALGIGEKTADNIVSNETSSASSLSFVSVGSPINHVSVKIATDRGEPFATGTTGHIFIKGDSVTKGYFRDDELNASSISPNGWLDTGDLGFFHQDQLYITGRAKDIIFVSGQNVYPHDLEEIVFAKGIVERGKLAISSKRSDTGDREELIAFVMHRGGRDVFEGVASGITRELGESAGVRVDRIVAVPRLPKTTSGKVQRYVLLKGLESGDYEVVISNTPESDTDEGMASDVKISDVTSSDLSITEQLQAICVAKTEGMNVGVDDNLFDLGISSLMLAEIHATIEETWPGRVDVTDLFDYPTVSELAIFLERESEPEPEPEPALG